MPSIVRDLDTDRIELNCTHVFKNPTIESARSDFSIRASATALRNYGTMNSAAESDFFGKNVDMPSTPNLDVMAGLVG